jgi:hypothetical protein
VPLQFGLGILWPLRYVFHFQSSVFESWLNSSFAVSVQVTEAGLFLMVDTTSRIIHFENVLQDITRINRYVGICTIMLFLCCSNYFAEITAEISRVLRSQN